MKTSFGPKSKVIFVRISALSYSRAEILEKVTLLFGPNDVFIKLLRFLLTFRGHSNKLLKKRQFLSTNRVRNDNVKMDK